MAEDDFRRRVISLDYEIREVWVCEWERLRADKGTAVSRFCAGFILPGGPSSFPLEQTFGESDILAGILDERINGLIMADFCVPQEHRLQYHFLSDRRAGQLVPVVYMC